MNSHFQSSETTSTLTGGTVDLSGHRELARFAPERARDRLDQAGGDQQRADQLGRDVLAGGQQHGAGAQQDDRDSGGGEAARAVPARKLRWTSHAAVRTPRAASRFHSRRDHP
jgi:hypothetical protein